ncbi:MAG TPA: hypothetical protein VFB36_11200 [Nevskiaceae bacterium]|nr:hypothetical protein [Nevskiaceae bacterium]
MLAIRRLFLLLFVLAAPPLLTAGLYVGSQYLLRVTNRTIDPRVLTYAAVVEFVVFFWVAILEARSRWSA